MRILLTFEESRPGISEPEGSIPARVLFVTERRHGSARGTRDRRYSWVEDHLSRLEGKEARGAYYARLDG